MEEKARELSERLLDYGDARLRRELEISNFKICTLQFTTERSDRSLYRLKLAERAGLIPSKDLQPLLNEADELIKIVAKSVITAKSKEK